MKLYPIALFLLTLCPAIQSSESSTTPTRCRTRCGPVPASSESGVYRRRLRPRKNGKVVKFSSTSEYPGVIFVIPKKKKKSRKKKIRVTSITPMQEGYAKRKKDHQTVWKLSSSFASSTESVPPVLEKFAPVHPAIAVTAAATLIVAHDATDISASSSSSESTHKTLSAVAKITAALPSSLPRRDAVSLTAPQSVEDDSYSSEDEFSLTVPDEEIDEDEETQDDDAWDL